MASGTGVAAAFTLVWALVLSMTSMMGTSESAFTGTTINPTSTLTAGTLNPPTSFTANRTCVGPAYRASTTKSTAGSTSLTLTTPATSTRDYLILAVTTYGATDPASVNTPAGWTYFGSNTGDGSETKVELTVFARPAPASPPASYSITFSASTAAVAALTSYSNTGSLEGWIGNYGITSTATATGMTTNAKDQLILAIFSHSGTSSSTPAGMALSAGLNAASAGLHQYHQVVAASGTATGTKTSTINATNPAWGSFSVLLGPSYGTTINLSWAATPDTWADGYEIIRNPGSTNTVGGRSTLSYSDSTTAGSTGYTYTITSTANTWRSTTQTATVAGC
jgi:hypothetical protein